MRISFSNIVRLNFALVLCIALYGYLTDESYWREVGHWPSLYNYLMWFGLILNGPAGFIADKLSALMHDDYLAQYGLWLLLLWPQWKAYDGLAEWSAGCPWRKLILTVAIVGITAVGSVMACETWHPLFFDRVFSFVRVVAVGLSGLVILAYVQMRRVPART